MELQKLFDMWDQDAMIDRNNLGNESLAIPRLHAKYWRILVEERLRMRKLEADLKQLEALKYDWAMGVLPREELEQRGWQPNPRKMLRAEADKYVESDPEVIRLTLLISAQKEKIEFLLDVIKTVANRTFQVKNAIEFAKYQAGSF